MPRKPRSNANGEGSIYQLAPKRWCGQTYVVDAAGTRRRVTVYATTKREVDAKLSQLKTKAGEGGYVHPERRSLRDYLVWWLEHKAAGRLRPRTLQSYTRMLELHVYPYLGNANLQTLTPVQVQTLYGERIHAGLSPRSVQYLHAILRKALGDAEKLDLVARNVCTKVEPPQKIEPDEKPALSVYQARRLLAAVRDEPGEALVTLALCTGMRQGEILGLHWTDVDWATEEVDVRYTLSWVRGEGPRLMPPKSKNSRRTLPLIPPVVDALRRHRLRQLGEREAAGERWQGSDLVFCTSSGRPLEPTNMLRDWFHPALAKAELPRIRFHDLRHSAGSLLIDLGADLAIVQRILGHSQIGITADTYIHMLTGTQRKALDRLGEALAED